MKGSRTELGRKDANFKSFRTFLEAFIKRKIIAWNFLEIVARARLCSLLFLRLHSKLILIKKRRRGAGKSKTDLFALSQVIASKAFVTNEI